MQWPALVDFFLPHEFGARGVRSTSADTFAIRPTTHLVLALTRPLAGRMYDFGLCEHAIACLEAAAPNLQPATQPCQRQGIGWPLPPTHRPCLRCQAAARRRPQHILALLFHD